MNQRGFTLLEFMVAITISLLLLTGILQLYLNVSRTNTEMARTNLQIENGRFALQLIEQDLQHASFWNGYVPVFDDRSNTAAPADVPVIIPDPCAAFGPLWDANYKTALLGMGIQVYDQSALPCPAILTNVLPNTDVLVVRHVETCVPGVGACDPDTPGALYLQVSQCISGPTPDLVAYKLDTANFNLRKRSCAVAPTAADFTQKRKYISYIYYVRDFSVTPGDGIPTLMRSEFDLNAGVLAFQPAQPLIEGIEGFRVELGIDNLSKTGAPVNYAVGAAADGSNRGDSVPDPQPAQPAPYANQAFIRCGAMANPNFPTCTIDQLINTVAVKVFVLVRNTEASLGYVDTKSYNLGSLIPADPKVVITPAAMPVPPAPLLPAVNYQRHLYSTMVRLNNVSVRRETPP